MQFPSKNILRFVCFILYFDTLRLKLMWGQDARNP